MLTSRDGSPAGLMLVLRRLFPGPEMDHVLLLAEALTAGGTAVVVVAEGGALEHEIARRGARFVELELDTTKARRARANAGRLAALVRENGLALIHAQDDVSLCAAGPAAQEAGVPLVATAHRPFAVSRPLRSLCSSALAASDRLTVSSDFVADQLQRDLNVPSDRLQVLRDGIDLAALDPAAIGGERLIELARPWQLPDDHAVILAPALAGGRRELFTALQEVDDLAYVCVLVPRYEEALVNDLAAVKAEVARAGPAGRVFLAEPCRDMAAALKLADVVVLPTHEPLGFQRLLAEAQAMGRPAIVSAVGGAVEQVSDGETGFLVAPGAADVLAVALRHALCLSSIERQRLSVNSIFQARKHYDRKQTIEQTLQIYRDLLQRQS